MDYNYFHSKTSGSPGVEHYSYGTSEIIHDLNKGLSIQIPIKSKNIQARIGVLEGASLQLPDEGVLFSLDNLVSDTGGEYVFRTRYYNATEDLGKFGSLGNWDRKLSSGQFGQLQATPVEHEYGSTYERFAEDVGGLRSCSVLEVSKVFERYQQLVHKIIGKNSAQTMGDIGKLVEYVAEHTEWGDIYGETPQGMLDKIEMGKKATASCVGKTLFRSWLLSVASVKNRIVGGGIAADEITVADHSYSGKQYTMHEWSEIQINKDGTKLWIPNDGTNVPYLRNDTVEVYFLYDKLPILESESSNKSGYVLQLDEVIE